MLVRMASSKAKSACLLANRRCFRHVANLPETRDFPATSLVIFALMAALPAFANIPFLTVLAPLQSGNAWGHLEARNAETPRLSIRT